MSTPVKVKVGVVAPLILPPLDKFVAPLGHWYVQPVPVALAVTLTFAPGHTVCVVAGCEVMTTASLRSEERRVGKECR